VAAVSIMLSLRAAGLVALVRCLRGRVGAAPSWFSGVTGVMLTVAACGVGRADDSANTVVVPGDVNHATLHDLQRVRGRHLTREELLELHRVWIDNEVLYREGLKLPLEPGEAGNREHVIFKALGALDQQMRSASVTEEELRRWFERRRERYEQPARFDFEDAALPSQSSESAVRALVDALNSGATADTRASLRTFKGRPESNLVQSFGQEVAQRLAQAPPGKWLALRARDGWRAMRLIARTPASHAVFEVEREAVRRDWIEEKASVKRSAAVQELWKKYKIEFAETIECLADE
jgi:hypothetical protein